MVHAAVVNGLTDSMMQRPRRASHGRLLSLLGKYSVRLRRSDESTVLLRFMEVVEERTSVLKSQWSCRNGAGPAQPPRSRGGEAVVEGREPR